MKNQPVLTIMVMALLLIFIAAPMALASGCGKICVHSASCSPADCDQAKKCDTSRASADCDPAKECVNSCAHKSGSRAANCDGAYKANTSCNSKATSPSTKNKSVN